MAAQNDAPGAYENDVPLPSPDLLAKAREAGWPDDLTHRIAALRCDSGMIQEWLDSGFPPIDGLESFVSDQERIFDGPLRLREATWADSEMISDLYANAPETVDDWEVVSERSPFPYAQLRLQEHPSLIVLEERKLGLGCAARSTRNAIVDGREMSVGLMSGWRVRSGHRGKGYARLLQMAPGPGTSWFGMLSYWYVRSGNIASTWIERVVDDMEDRPEEFAVEAQGLTATVTHVAPRDTNRDPRIRNATVDDLGRCAELNNELTAGLDLARPVSAEYLRTRLDDPTWGAKPPFWDEVYQWEDFFVVEEAGKAVACAGLWDRGRHMRDIWTHNITGDTFTVDHTAVVDAGCIAGHEDALGALLRFFVGRTHDIGRTAMIVALEHHPTVMAGLDGFDLTPEARAVHFIPMSMPGLEFEPPTVTRPHTDLSYW